MIVMQCPHCGKQLSIPEEYAGKKGLCKKCGGLIIMPVLPQDFQEPPPIPDDAPGEAQPADHGETEQAATIGTGTMIFILLLIILAAGVLFYFNLSPQSRENIFQNVASGVPTNYENRTVSTVKKGHLKELNIVGSALGVESITVGELLNEISGGSVIWSANELLESSNWAETHTLVEARWKNENSVPICFQFLVEKDGLRFLMHGASVGDEFVDGETLIEELAGAMLAGHMMEKGMKDLPKAMGYERDYEKADERLNIIKEDINNFTDNAGVDPSKMYTEDWGQGVPTRQPSVAEIRAAREAEKLRNYYGR